MTGHEEQLSKTSKLSKLAVAVATVKPALPALIRNPVLSRLRRTPTLDEAAPGPWIAARLEIWRSTLMSKGLGHGGEPHRANETFDTGALGQLAAATDCEFSDPR